VPRYFLSLRDGEFLQDNEGREYPDAGAAMRAALRGAREIMAEDVKRGVLHLNECVEITDAKGELVAKVLFRDAIEIQS